jgi:hypothetical protein
MIDRRFLACEPLRHVFLGNPEVEGVARQNSWSPAPAISPRKFIVFQTVPQVYCQNQNVTKTVTARVQNANALGLKMAARSSEVGCDTPQKWQRKASDDTVAEQFLQLRFDLRMARREENPTRVPWV